MEPNKSMTENLTMVYPTFMTLFQRMQKLQEKCVENLNNFSGTSSMTLVANHIEKSKKLKGEKLTHVKKHEKLVPIMSD